MAAAIDELAKECVQSQDAASTATLLDVLEKAGIAKRFRIHPESVVVADTNRDEYGVTAKDVCENVEDVVITKWHDSLFRGVATDIPGPQFEKVCQFNEALAAGSGGRLPPIKREHVQYKALRGNHTSSGHRAILNSCVHPSLDLTTDGKLNMAKILQQCPTLGPVLTMGAQWLVVPSTFLTKYPGLEEDIIGTSNFINNISKTESDLQILGKVAAKLKQGLTFDAIKQLLTKQRYRNVAALPGMFQMCRKYATCANGGDLVSETQMFVKSQFADSRTIDGSLFDALVVDVRGAEQLPRLRHALLSALLLEDPNLLGKASIQKILHNRDILVHAVQAESDANSVYLQIKATNLAKQPEVLAAFGAYQMALACNLVGKRTKWLIAQIAQHEMKKQHFVDDSERVVSGVLGSWLVKAVFDATQIKLTNMFDRSIVALQPKIEIDKDESRVRISTAGDRTAFLMNEMNFEVGANVHSRGSHGDQIFVITSFATGEASALHISFHQALAAL